MNKTLRPAAGAVARAVAPVQAYEQVQKNSVTPVILGWLNYIFYKVWDEITYPFLNINTVLYCIYCIVLHCTALHCTALHPINLIPGTWQSNLQLLEVPYGLQNKPNSQIPQCTCSISHNAPFRTEISALTGALWDMEQVLFGVCELGPLWVLSIIVSGNSYATMLLKILIIA